MYPRSPWFLCQPPGPSGSWCPVVLQRDPGAQTALRLLAVPLITLCLMRRIRRKGLNFESASPVPAHRREKQLHPFETGVIFHTSSNPSTNPLSAPSPRQLRGQAGCSRPQPRALSFPAQLCSLPDSDGGDGAMAGQAGDFASPAPVLGVPRTLSVASPLPPPAPYSTSCCRTKHRVWGISERCERSALPPARGCSRSPRGRGAEAPLWDEASSQALQGRASKRRGPCRHSARGAPGPQGHQTPWLGTG